MRNPTIYRASFKDLICTAFAKEQVLKMRIEITMYQASESPERWSHTPTLPTGRPHLEAGGPLELAQMLEGAFIERTSDWLIFPGRIPVAAKGTRLNVVPIDHKRRA